MNRLHNLILDNTSIPNTYTLNDASPDATDAWAYGKKAQALAPASQATGSNTQAGIYGYRIGLKDGKLDITNLDENDYSILILNSKSLDLKVNDEIAITST